MMYGFSFQLWFKNSKVLKVTLLHSHEFKRENTEFTFCTKYKHILSHTNILSHIAEMFIQSLPLS